MKDFLILLPEAILLLTALVLFLGETTHYGEKRRPTLWIGMLGLGAAAAQVILGYRLGAVSGFQRTLMSDGLGLFIRLSILCFAACTLVAVQRARELHQYGTVAETSALILLLTAGVSLVSGATHLGTIWVLLALVFGVGAVLLGAGRGAAFSAEGGIKFLPFAAIALLFFSLASALLFARTGSFHLAELQKAQVFSLFSPAQQVVIFVLFFFALAIPVGVFPFHYWAVDAFQGAPTVLAGFVQTGFRLSATAVLARMFSGVFAQATTPGVWNLYPGSQFTWPTLLAAVLAASALWVSALALRQTRLRRMLAALGLAQGAQIWVGFLVLDETGFAATLYSSVVLGFALLGSFIIVAWFSEHRRSDRFADLAGALWLTPRESSALGVFLLFVAGVPPLPGFFAQFTLVSSALRAGRYLVAGALIGSWVFSAAAVSKALLALWGPYRSALQADSSQAPRESRTLLLALLFPLVALVFGSEWLFQFASRSLELILW